jgi:predicted dehydrogenase
MLTRPKNQPHGDVAHEFRHTPQRAYIKQLLDEGYIGKFQLCTISCSRPLRVAAASPVHLDGPQIRRRRAAGALGSHYIDGLRFWFGEVASVSGRLATLRPDLVDPATGRKVAAETDDTFSFTLSFKNGGMATMISSFATTPTRGAKIGHG